MTETINIREAIRLIAYFLTSFLDIRLAARILS